jgi:hypothetical protein
MPVALRREAVCVDHVRHTSRMPELSRGLYERLITDGLAADIAALPQDLAKILPLRPAEAADRIGAHVARQIEVALEAVSEQHRVDTGVTLARSILAIIDEQVQRAAARQESPVTDGIVLRAIGDRLPDGSVRHPAEPLVPLLDTTLLTNAPGEPRVLHQVRAEIESADAIDLVMAFIRTSALSGNLW